MWTQRECREHNANVKSAAETQSGWNEGVHACSSSASFTARSFFGAHEISNARERSALSRLNQLPYGSSCARQRRYVKAGRDRETKRDNDTRSRGRSPLTTPSCPKGHWQNSRSPVPRIPHLSPRRTRGVRAMCKRERVRGSIDPRQGRREKGTFCDLGKSTSSLRNVTWWENDTLNEHLEKKKRYVQLFRGVLQNCLVLWQIEHIGDGYIISLAILFFFYITIFWLKWINIIKLNI